MPNANTASDATGLEVFTRGLAMVGADKASAALALIPMVPLGRMPRLYAPASRVLTLADTRGGVISSTNPGTTILTLPTMAQLGITRDANNPLEFVFIVQRGVGAGPFFLNPSVYLGSVASQAAMLALSAQVGDWCQRSDLANQRFYLAVAGASTLANWTAVTPGASNAPGTAITINWNNIDPQYLSAGHAPILLVSNGLDSYEAS